MHMGESNASEVEYGDSDVTRGIKGHVYRPWERVCWEPEFADFESYPLLIIFQ